MAKDCIKIGTTVTTSLKRWVLFKGTILAILGVGFLVYGGVAMPAKTLSSAGIVLWLIGMTLMAIGMIPYKRLCRLENRPHELVITDDNKLHYMRRRKKVLSVPLYEIEQIEAIGSTTSYGIGLKLKKGYSGTFPRQEKNLVKYGFDIYLPYFTPRACRSLKAYWEES